MDDESKVSRFYCSRQNSAPVFRDNVSMQRMQHKLCIFFSSRANQDGPGLTMRGSPSTSYAVGYIAEICIFGRPCIRAHDRHLPRRSFFPGKSNSQSPVCRFSMEMV